MALAIAGILGTLFGSIRNCFLQRSIDKKQQQLRDEHWAMSEFLFQEAKHWHDLGFMELADEAYEDSISVSMIP